ncbi:hypothetical protein JD79_04015 [Geodermatophilus normandii]|uniref:Uncharacterized protein n=1 Tax=Geodermatophilus normandii TaxID=1137989 RepID=A0A317QPD2_9ACTN|nr:hypothetical protein [Geodermatophilus normandii]PWW24824.1 hypothetical protein JD79_04015 [Geodermatophilus normandii]
MTSPATTGPVLAELRPSGRSYGAYALPLVPLAAVLLVVRLTGDGLSLGGSVAVAAGVVAVAGVVALLYFRGTSLVLTPGALVYRSPLARDRVVAPGDVSGGVLVPRYRVLNGPESVLFALLGHDGRALVRIQGVHWDAGQVTRFARATGVPLTEVPQPVDRRDLRPWCPGALPVAERRPVAFFLTVLGGTLLVVAVLVVVLVAAGV